MSELRHQAEVARRQIQVLEGLNEHEGWRLIIEGMDARVMEVHALMAQPSNVLEDRYQTNKEFLGGRYSELLAFSRMREEMMEACQEIVSEWEILRQNLREDEEYDDDV